MTEFFTPETSLWGLLLTSFLSATLLPGGSEVALFAVLKLHPDLVWPAIGVATLGNTLGGMSSYLIGRLLPARGLASRVSPSRLEQVRRWGSPSLLLAWAPLIGDVLCVAAGWLRLNWMACLLFMAIGKFLRYWIVAQGAVWP